ncbi:MAG TPA: glycosyltransferase family 4 protein [Puia sp.]|jgi:glycosyltransferase involved in cell wall biosynthesis
MASNLSIAFVANTSWSIYKFRLYLLEKLSEQGFTIYVLAPRDPYTVHFEQIPGLTYIELKKLRSKSISPRQDWLLYRELLGHYRRIRPSLIFHYTIKANIFGTLAAHRARIPSVSVITGLGYTFVGKGWLQTAVKFLYRQALQKNTQTWFLNEDDRSVFIAEKLVRPEKTFVLPGEGVDTDIFYPAPYELPDLPSAPPKPVTFLLIGRLIRPKGICEFVAAAEQLRRQGLSIRCQVLGFYDQPNPASIPRQQVEEWDRSGVITYLGHTDNVVPFIGEADCIVLPSYYREGMPLSLLEGASMCKTLIATDTAGCRDIITDGVNGYLCGEKDPAALAEKMKAYYQLPAAAKRQMGMEGRNKVLQYFKKEIITGIYLDKINTLRVAGQGQ